MPTCRNKPSMPKVRASSGTIGTTRGPMASLRNNVDRIRTNTIVVENSRSPDGFSCRLEGVERRHLQRLGDDSS